MDRGGEKADLRAPESRPGHQRLVLLKGIFLEFVSEPTRIAGGYTTALVLPEGYCP